MVRSGKDRLYQVKTGYFMEFQVISG